MSYFLGLDTSTTATKSLLIDEMGRVVGVASSDYVYQSPRPLWSEQDPELWWEATRVSIKALLAETGISSQEVVSIGLTGQMHGLVILDRNGSVIRPAILWNDQRTAAQCDEIRERVGRERLIAITGNDALTGFTAPKILWVQQEEPENYAQIAHILLPKDYVRYRLTGEYAIDRAGGAGTILFDLASRNWSEEVSGALGIAPEWLPPSHEGTEITGVLTKEAGDLLGLQTGTPVVAGGGDQAAAAVGTGAVIEGVVSLSLGTSGVVFATVGRPIIEPGGRLHAFCHALNGKWHLMGVMLSAAGSLRWHRDTFASGVQYGDLLEPAGEIAIGSDGLLFLPYLTGERTPHPDPLARGGFIGLTVRHELAHMTRAVLEGVAFGMRDIFELIGSLGPGDIDQVRVTGGGARSRLWLQILADVLGTELITVTTEEGAAYGAAVLAATGAGHFENVESACDQVISIEKRFSPGKAASAYDDLYPVYRELYPALKPSFQLLSNREQ